MIIGSLIHNYLGEGAFSQKVEINRGKLKWAPTSVKVLVKFKFNCLLWTPLDFSFSETTDQIFRPQVNFSNSIIFR